MNGRKRNERTCGVLLHLTSLPSPFGIGDLGYGAYCFADWLASAGQRLWQILPMNPTDPAQYHSPYAAVSAFAGNPLLVSPELLAEEGLVDRSDLDDFPGLPDHTVDFAAVHRAKIPLLLKACGRIGRLGKDLEEFCAAEDYWLNDYAAFRTLKNHFHGAVWTDWPKPLRDRNPDAIKEALGNLADQVRMVKAVQFLFYRQYQRLRAYLNQRGIRVFGDIPIYVTLDSSDVWSNPDLFQLDENKRPVFVAGVPPDYFSETGQLWGNPVYDWDRLKETGYRWWIRRMEFNLRHCDLTRVDHFRGFLGYWRIPADHHTAINGEWIKGPGEALFNAFLERFDDLPIVAEDLGTITDDVRQAMTKFDFPGMRVLLFAFAPDMAENPHAPHNHVVRSAVYTGTHDNNTARGWFENEADPETRRRVMGYLGKPVLPEQLPWELVRVALGSRAETCILPMQDLLSLDQSARMNHPATVTGNWQWRVTEDQLMPELAQKLFEAVRETGRSG